MEVPAPISTSPPSTTAVLLAYSHNIGGVINRFIVNSETKGAPKTSAKIPTSKATSGMPRPVELNKSLGGILSAGVLFKYLAVTTKRDRWRTVAF